MTLDATLNRAVSHYLGGILGLVHATHSEIEFKGSVSEELRAEIHRAAVRFGQTAEDLLANPAKYAKVPDYRLSGPDREFLQRVVDVSGTLNWEDKKEVDDLFTLIKGYCPNFGGGIASV